MLDRPAAPDLYRALLGPAFDRLHPHLQSAHSCPLRATGTVDVLPAESRIGRALARTFHLPPPGLGQSLTLDIRQQGDEQRWSRVFGNQDMTTLQSNRAGYLRERAGAVILTFGVDIVDGAVLYTSRQTKLFGIPLPPFLAPVTTARIVATDSGWTAEVEVRLRPYGMLCRYTASVMLP